MSLQGSYRLSYKKKNEETHSTLYHTNRHSLKIQIKWREPSKLLFEIFWDLNFKLSEIFYNSKPENFKISNMQIWCLEFFFELCLSEIINDNIMISDKNSVKTGQIRIFLDSIIPGNEVFKIVVVEGWGLLELIGESGTFCVCQTIQKRFL